MLAGFVSEFFTICPKYVLRIGKKLFTYIHVLSGGSRVSQNKL